jgi:hypothetical protein
VRSTLLLLVATSCNLSCGSSGEREVTLAGFSALRVYANEQSVKIVLDDGEGSPRYGPCSVTDAKLTAQLNGVSVPVIRRGGKIGESPGDDVSDNDCESPLLQLDMPPPDGSSTLELSDSAITLTCTLPDLKAARQAMLVPPQSGTWTWQPRQPVAVQWSPSGDLQLWSLITVDLLHVTPQNVIDDVFEIRNVVFDGDLVRFTVPSAPPGSYILELRPSRAVSCGSTPVEAQLTSTLTEFGIGQSVTIVP